MKFAAILLLCSLAAQAQVAVSGKASLTGKVTIGLGAATTVSQITLSGATNGSVVNYYAAHPDQRGDTNYCIQTAATYASGGSAGTHTINFNDGAGNQTVSGTLLCTFNDGHTISNQSRNIGLYKITTLDMSSAANTTFAAVNDMSSYGTGTALDTPTGWAGQGTSGQGSIYNWKSGPLVAVGGWVVMPIFRQQGPGFFAGGDATFSASPDGGAHWCNPYTFAHHTGSPGCDSANWKADGDAPLQPSDTSYTSTPSSMMYRDASPYDGSTNKGGRFDFFNYCQDNACTGSPNGADTYLYFFMTNGRQTEVRLGRVLKSITSIMDLTAHQYYTCASYSPANVCDGTSGGSWTSTLASATMIFSGDGGIANGSGASINPIPTGYTDQRGFIFGNPVYYCANSGCAYAAVSFNDHLLSGLGRSSIMAFAAPWGPFAPTTSEFVNTIPGFWTMMRHTIKTPDATAYHARFIMVGDSYTAPFDTSESSVGFQAYDFTIDSTKSYNTATGCTPYRFADATDNYITRTGLYAFFDFFSHGCYDSRTGNIYNASIFSNDLVTYPPSKQLIGCYSDAGVKCGNPNAGHGLELTTDGVRLTDGYSPRLELRDTVPGVYSAITTSPLVTSADPLWTVGMVIQPTNIAASGQGLMEAGAAQPNSTLIYASYSGATGKVSVVWGAPTRITTTNPVMSDGNWYYVVVSRSGTGAPTACSTLPCSNNTHIYINGAEVTTVLTTGGSNPNVSAGPTTFGTISGNVSFTGKWAIAETYSRALTATEIATNFLTHQFSLVARGIYFGGTSTQALISYTAPTTGACTIEASESATFSPVVNDVNATLYTNANLDSRTGSIGSGIAALRTFVLGSRLSALALDSNVYSRALQAYTRIYYRVTCNSTVIVASSFPTANIPVGDTFNESYPADPANPGSWLTPTLSGSRSQTIVDPLKGSLLSPVSLPADQVGGMSGSIGVDLYSGARIHVFNSATHTDGSGNVGYLANLDGAGAGYTHLYYIVPSTGESRLLGLIDSPLTGGTIDDSLQGYAYTVGSAPTTLYNYTGNYAAGVGGHPGAITLDSGASYLTSSIETLVHNFDSSFDTTKYACDRVRAFPGPVGRYFAGVCKRAGTQDAYGWFFVFDGNTKTVVAAWFPYVKTATKYCGNHEFEIVPDNIMEVNWHYLTGNASAALGTNTIGTTVSGTAMSGASQITVAADPASIVTGGDTVSAPVPAIGDHFIVQGTSNGSVGNPLVLTSKSGNTWQFTPALSQSLSGGEVVQMICSVGNGTDGDEAITYWPFLTDPNGNAPVVDLSYPGGGHMDTAPTSPGARVAEDPVGWVYHPYTTSVIGTLNQSGILINGTVSYNGVSPVGQGVPLTRHPSFQQTAASSTWFLDRVGFNGGACCSSPVNDYFYSKGPTQTTITAGLNSSQTNISLGCGGSCAQFPTGLVFQIDTELFLITAGGGTASPTAQRGQYGTTAASHSNGQTVTVSGALNISGSLYAYIPDAQYPLHRKLVPTQASNGGNSLRDISSTAAGNQIGTGSGDNYKYCVAYVAGECRTGSSAGNVYFNVPTLGHSYCNANAGPYPIDLDICITDTPADSGTLMQVYMGATSAASRARSRNFTYGLAGVKVMAGYPLAKASPDGSFALFTVGDGITAIDVWKAKMTPLPASDGIDRTGYIAKPIVISNPPATTDNIVVRFWYTEYGGYCTTRAENCYAVAGTIPSDPFKFPADGTSQTLATLSGMPCSAGCIPVIPAISQHMVYYQVTYRNNTSNGIISSDPVGVLWVP